ncbi:2OG-Fe(II) oxygenase [Planctobacterium marinum]|uniref:2OG-Fe(II) oxygenase n=1 Tax=Planctobacterium marinum TaxID=1631968 RepID=UPI001E389232|nr:2OG-Fe(II) oxygenase [Planctobacterium marinum]MCC2607708.1 2OG-Fe(II) oxygenase [Planctobacterium marinum]
MTDFIKVIPNALDNDTCDNLMAKFAQHPGTFEGRTGGGVDTSKKVSRDISISNNPEFQEEFTKVVHATTRQVIDYFDEFFFAFIGPLGIKVRHPQTGEPTNITDENYEELAKPKIDQFIPQFFRFGDVNMQKYEAGKGGYPYWHSEVYPQMPNNEALHRILLFMYYLNDVDEGGETEFYYQKKRIKPEKGTMVIAPAYFTHTHRGNVPISGDKQIITSWVLFQRAEHLYRG